MTEDGRFSGMAALCSHCSSFFQDWDNQDAQLDAIENSLWPSMVSRSHCVRLTPTSQRRDVGHPHRFSITKFALFEEISYENVPGK